MIGEVANQTHDFGKIIADTGTRSHSYAITNVTDKDLSITKVTNNKTCCGGVDPVAKFDLAPGETVPLRVELKLGHSATTVQHLATVETNSEAMPHLEFRTTTEVVPRVWIEEVGGEKSKFKIGEAAVFSFKIMAQSDQVAGPIRLDDESVIASCRLEWSGPRQDTEQAGATLSARQVRLVVPPHREPGSYVEYLKVHDQKVQKLSHPILYDVVAEVVASPGAAVFREGRREVTIQLAVSGDVPFRILEVDQADTPLKVSVDLMMPGTRH